MSAAFRAVPRRARELLRRGGFGRNVAALMTGTTLAQAIVFAVSPVLTRIYSPEAFGLYGVYTAIAIVIGGLAAGCYELGIVLPKQDDHARSLLQLGILLATATALVTLLVLLGWRASHWALAGLEGNSALLLVVPAGVWLMALISLFTQWHIRGRGFTTISYSVVFQSTTAALLQIAAGLFLENSALALIGGQLGGQLVALVVLRPRRTDALPRHTGSQRILRLLAIGRRYRSFPKHMIAAGLITRISAAAPTFAFGWAYSPAVVGWFTLAQRIIAAPMSIVGQSFAAVYQQRASELAKQDPPLLRKRTLEMALWLFLLGMVPVAVLMVAGPALLAWIFGAAWRQTGEFARYMAIYLWLQFGLSPASRLFAILEEQYLYVTWEWIRLVLCVAGLALGVFYFEPIGALLWFTGGMSVAYLLLGLLMLATLRKHAIRWSPKPP